MEKLNKSKRKLTAKARKQRGIWREGSPKLEGGNA
jgi:hypothetical protein